MRSRISLGLGFIAALGVLTLVHYPLLRLPYFWDEAGYYIPAALDFYHHGLLIPQNTMPTGHTPLMSVYLGWAWWFLGFSPLVTRVAMIVLATGTLAALYALGRTVTRRETAAWACVLLALSPVFFAQSSLAHLDLPVALTTTAAILALLRRRLACFALLLSLAVLTKETAVVILPVVWIYAWRIRKELNPSAAAWLTLPLAPLAAWALYYHHVTGFWTGNPAYLKYNLYSTLTPARIAVTLLRRLYQVLVAGFNWLLPAAAILGYRKLSKAGATSGGFTSLPAWQSETRKDFFFLSAGLTFSYLAMLSVVGGAVLPRYLLPIFPCFYLALMLFVDCLPRPAMRGILVLIAACFIASWFINPLYPFPYEDNLAYADFIHLHQQAANFLSSQPEDSRILTAWPATDELTEPDLGYVKKPLRVAGIEGFTAQDFSNVSPRAFDLLYLYSRKWNPPDNWLRRFWWAENALEYVPAVPAADLAREFHLKLLASFRERGQWVEIYSRQ
jgi:4-amino-4-deoxy-L-arabinose transferase-like glycosyltransferase